jgi:hypothetical protein
MRTHGRSWLRVPQSSRVRPGFGFGIAKKSAIPAILGPRMHGRRELLQESRSPTPGTEPFGSTGSFAATGKELFTIGRDHQARPALSQCTR